MIAEKIYGFVERKLTDNPNWTKDTTLKERWRFFQATGLIPGYHTKSLTKILVTLDVQAELADGKQFCAMHKYLAAIAIGLNIDRLI
jgi:hypothetical protein